MIVDTHVHLLPGRLGEKVRAIFEAYIPGRLSYPNDHAAVLAAAERAGVGQVWSLPYAHKPGVAAGLNEASARLAARPPHPSVQVVGGATVHPGDADPERVVGRAIDELGLRVLKLHCSVGDFRADDPAFDAMWRLVERRRLPAVVHVGHAVTGHTRSEELAALENVARRHPQAPLIIAHAAHPASAAAIELIGRCPNVLADLTPVVTEPVEVPAEVLEEHADRFLFGTDAPNVALTIESGMARLDGLSPAARAAILGGNARRLLAEVR
ncbi:MULTISPECIES: amidohydrolase family protein [Thermomonospora]|uniref:Amidohydrolase 2 n=1 Tax=Thermomonospora curvata (strain ATCC 19995 / DSM 43183 / JCM 3096 / KCTC 9072 / NBRC 15933 / NCIMB 10081 / Henssen B9) TaxID=471852 RepID=D1A6A6_THECD|nr:MULTISPECIES: amidohydrolase family protein [Thermomonospora]ACZ00205.1 amidohydrolase 2 [Thermomonospora curvata DSM 43183]PKK12015.1 MAG: amidohydrolase [Thermomonospora sp. CIF 1]